MKRIKIEIPEGMLLNPEGFNSHKFSVKEMRYIDSLIHVAKTKEQVDFITKLYMMIETLTDADEKAAYMDRFFQELEKIKGKADDGLRASVVSKLTETEFKQLFHNQICIGYNGK